MTISRSLVLPLCVGILLGLFPPNVLAAGIGTTSSKLNNLRIGINRSSKDNGGSLSYTGAEYATHRPYKIDFDLLQASDRSHELEMPMLHNNDILDESKDSDFMLASDPTLRSRRRRRRQAESQQQQQLPSQQQQQAPFQQLGMFQGPIPVQRQREELPNIHTKYPYPYPPTLDVAQQQPVQAVVPESIVNPTSENTVGAGGNVGGVTTDAPTDVSQTTLLPEGPAVEQLQGGQQDPAPPAGFPDSPVVQQSQEPGAGNVEAIQTTTYNPALMTSSSQPAVDPSTPSPQQEQEPPAASQGGSVPVSPDNGNPAYYPPPQSIQVQQHPPQPDPALLNRLREQEEEIRNVKSQLEQANLQVVSYEQENAMVKDQFMRSEEANIKLRDRVLQLENTNQHLQEQNGQLQQTTAEQRQQINGLKESVKEAKDQFESFQNQVSPLTEEAQNHRKEIEDFLIRIRKLGEENETCKKQVRLYQLKVNYIMEQQRQQQSQQQQQQQQPQQQQTQQQLRQPTQPQQQKKKHPSASSSAPQQPQHPTAADITAHVDVDDDELDPELSRMDAEIAALQRSADEVAAAIQNLPPVLPQQQPENLSSPAAVPVAVVKKENEFPGEAVQVDPQQTKHKQQQPEKKLATAADVARAESVSRTIPPGVPPAWEQPAGF